MKDYEIHTMQKDIEKSLKKKAVISEPPEKLPVVALEELPGAALPSEPMISSAIPFKPTEFLESSKSFGPPAPAQSKIEKPRHSRKFSVLAVLLVVLLVGVGIYYWWNYLRIPEPAGFLTADEFRTVESLNISIPADISRALGKKYTFFVYKQEQGAGFIVEITKREILEASLRNWENTMSEDLRLIFFGREPGRPVTEEFQNGLYKGAKIRYLNFTNSTLAIDYVLIKDYFVVTTSKESMFKVIDGALGE